MTINRVRPELDGGAAAQGPGGAPELGGVPGPASAAGRPQDAQRFRALVQARSQNEREEGAPASGRPATPKLREDDSSPQERPARRARERGQAADSEPIEADSPPPPTPQPLPDPVWWGVGDGKAPEPLQVSADRAHKPLATTAAQQAERGGLALGGVGARSFSALHAALGSLSRGAGKSSRFSVDSEGLGRLGFLVRRDQDATHVVLELDRDQIDQATELRKSVQSWLEARGHAGVRVAIALRAARPGSKQAGAPNAQGGTEEGLQDE